MPCSSMLSRFICVRLSATLWTVAHQALLSMGFSRQEYWSGCCALLQGIFPTQGSNPGLPALQEDSWLPEPPGKPKNIGVGSLFLLQGIFPTQESNWGPLHCRWILYKLNYQGSPGGSILTSKYPGHQVWIMSLPFPSWVTFPKLLQLPISFSLCKMEIIAVPICWCVMRNKWDSYMSSALAMLR